MQPQQMPPPQSAVRVTMGNVASAAHVTAMAVIVVNVASVEIVRSKARKKLLKASFLIKINQSPAKNLREVLRNM
jgi:hypothetical protein